MKKLWIILTAAVLLFVCTACSAPQNTAPSETEDFQPEQLTETETVSAVAPKLNAEELTSAELIRYFQAQGIFENGNGYKVIVQDHENYWSETPVRECICWWDNAETEVSVNILILDDSLPDSSKEAYKKWLREIEVTKSLPGENFSFGFIDHLAGNVAFSYQQGTADEAVLEKVEQAYRNFLKDSGLKEVY